MGKNVKGDIIAIINKLDSKEVGEKGYEVKIAKGMDVVFVLSSICAAYEGAGEVRESFIKRSTTYMAKKNKITVKKRSLSLDNIKMANKIKISLLRRSLSTS